MAETSRDSGPTAHNPRAISLRLVILFVTCCAVVLGLIWHWPGVVPVFAVAAVVVVIRAWTVARLRDWKAPKAALWRWGLGILGSVGVLSLVTATSFAAFCAVCLPFAASQFGQSRPVLFGAAWVLGGVVAAGIAAAMLELLWLRPWLNQTSDGKRSTFRERTGRFFQIALPPLSAIAIGGSWSALLAFIVAMNAPHSWAFSATAFILCGVVFIGGGWLGVKLSRMFPKSMVGVLSFSIGAVGAWGLLFTLRSLLELDPLMSDAALALDQSAPTWGLVAGLFSLVPTVGLFRWSHRP